jgi:hypothetical protein
VSDDKVIKKRYSDGERGRLEARSEIRILLTGIGIARRVIVRDDEAHRVQAQRLAKDLARAGERAARGAPKDPRTTDQPLAGVEESGGDDLLLLERKIAEKAKCIGRARHHLLSRGPTPPEANRDLSDREKTGTLRCPHPSNLRELLCSRGKHTT